MVSAKEKETYAFMLRAPFKRSWNWLWDFAGKMTPYENVGDAVGAETRMKDTPFPSYDA